MNTGTYYHFSLIARFDGDDLQDMGDAELCPTILSLSLPGAIRQAAEYLLPGDMIAVDEIAINDDHAVRHCVNVGMTEDGDLDVTLHDLATGEDTHLARLPF